jgi:hypothetical protein
MEIAAGLDVEIDEAMSGDLLEHVVEERHLGGELARAGAVEVQPDGYLRFERVSGDARLTLHIR